MNKEMGLDLGLETENVFREQQIENDEAVLAVAFTIKVASSYSSPLVRREKLMTHDSQSGLCGCMVGR